MNERTATPAMRLVFLTVWLLAVAGACGAADREIGDLVQRVGRTRWTGNNSVRLLSYPEESWEARLDLVGRARHHVFISTFSWHDDEFGSEFRRRLAATISRRRETNPDFKVYILVDATARGLFDRSFRRLEEAGAKVHSFNRASWGVSPLYDGRMHDKMVIVDGRWAIVGGRNIANEYFDTFNWWLDFGVLLEGDAVRDLQMNFLKAWETAVRFSSPHRFMMAPSALHRQIRTLWRTGRLRDGRSPLDKYLNADFFPRVDGRPGDYRVAVLYDNSLVRRPARSTELLIELAARARSEIDLMTPFPNLPPQLTDALESAIRRGVRLRLFVNSAKAAIRGGPFLLAGLPTIIRLAGAGAEVWEWSGHGNLDRRLKRARCSPERLPPSALHGKLARIDDDLTVVHSSNFNIRSTYYNTEAGAVVLDTRFNHRVRDLLDGLVSPRELEVACEEGSASVNVGRVVDRIDEDRLGELRRRLGDKQPFLDSTGLLW